MQRSSTETIEIHIILITSIKMYEIWYFPFRMVKIIETINWQINLTVYILLCTTTYVQEVA